MKRFFIIVLFLAINLFSATLQDDSCLDQNSTYKECILDTNFNKEPSIYKNLLSLDYLQNKISRKVLIFSSNLDYTLEKWLKDDTNSSSKSVLQSIEEEKEAYSFYSIVNLYNDFFKDDTYLSTTNRSYIRIRWGAESNAEEDFSYFNNFRVSIKLPQTEESLYLFIGDDEDDATKTIQETTTSFGIKYFLKNMEIFNTSISAGFRGIDNPFIKLRMEYPIIFKYVLFRPVQYIEYSLEDRFKEETQFYFDYRLENENDLIRLSMNRYTQTNLNGMNYYAQLSYLSTTKYNIGFQLYTNLNGRTKLNGTETINAKYNITPTTGVYNYSSGIIWKQQFFKKYLFYELQPLVQFAGEYDYNPNYIFRANIELYFGNI